MIKMKCPQDKWTWYEKSIILCWNIVSQLQMVKSCVSLSKPWTGRKTGTGLCTAPNDFMAEEYPENKKKILLEEYEESRNNFEEYIKFNTDYYTKNTS